MDQASWFLLQTKDCIGREEDDKSSPLLRCIQTFSIRMILDVWGGTGAIWGFSEILKLRDTNTVWFWRPVSIIFGCIFFCRWVRRLFEYWREVHALDNYVEQTQKHTNHIFQVFSTKLVLEVFGGAGAVWGFFEALALRHDDTNWFWRPVALICGFFFFMRWILQILHYVLEAKYDAGTHIGDTNQIIRLLHIFSARLVLEVFGSAGAIWGFSEALTLRTASTTWFWRPVTLLVGVAFFYRWFLQLSIFVLEMKSSDSKPVYEEVKATEQDNFSDEETADGDTSYNEDDYEESSELYVKAGNIIIV